MENTMVQRDQLPTSVQQWLTAGESLYATLIEDWLGVDAKRVLGRPFESLGFVKA